MGGFWFTRETHEALAAARQAARPARTDVAHLLSAFAFTSFPHAESVLLRAGISRRDLQALLSSKTTQEVAKQEIGRVYEGPVKGTMPFKAFVETIPGLEGVLFINEPPRRDPDYSPALIKIFETAMQLALAREERDLGTGHSLLGLLSLGHPSVAALKNRPLTLEAALPLLGEPGDLAGEKPAR